MSNRDIIKEGGTPQSRMGGKLDVEIASVGIADLPVPSACKHWQKIKKHRCWERVTGRGSYTTGEALHSQGSKAEKAF